VQEENQPEDSLDLLSLLLELQSLQIAVRSFPETGAIVPPFFEHQRPGLTVLLSEQPRSVY
jgi:hypothetical protein